MSESLSSYSVDPQTQPLGPSIALFHYRHTRMLRVLFSDEDANSEVSFIGSFTAASHSYMRYSIFWVVMQLKVVTDVSGQPICPVLKSRTVPEEWRDQPQR